MSVKVKVKKRKDDAVIPHYVHGGDAGMDIYSCENATIRAGERKLVSTGICLEIPKGYVALVWDKSGLASKCGIKTMAGVVDCSYRGEVGIMLLNTSKEDYQVRKGEKIAQILIQPIAEAEIEEIQELGDTKRGDGGFGSTGLGKN